jgi:hypothetical protein
MGQSQSTSTSQSTSNQLDDNKCYIFDDPPATAAYEWHLNDKKNSSALKKAKAFHSEYNKLYAEQNWLVSIEYLPFLFTTTRTYCTVFFKDQVSVRIK